MRTMEILTMKNQSSIIALQDSRAIDDTYPSGIIISLLK